MTFNFEEHRLNAVAEYQRRRPIFEAFAEAVRGIVKEALRAGNIQAASIEARAKEVESFGTKASKPSESDPERPKYPDPLLNITDLAGVRVITFFPKTAETTREVVLQEFEVVEFSDKAALLDDDRLGYKSVHFLVKLASKRLSLPEYSSYKNLVCELQIRTVLQHAWAEIEHDIQYKTASTIPSLIRKRFTALAGLLEIADREFQAIQDEDARVRSEARKSVEKGQFAEVEITADALKTYLDRKYTPDARLSEFSYEFAAEMVRALGFEIIEDLDKAITPYDDDRISRLLWGSRQGQLTRFEDVLLAALGPQFAQKHPWSELDWFQERCRRHLERLEEDSITPGVPDDKSDRNTN
ncbi:MAG: hypothetical protein OXG13_18445 [Gemmatimonadaceae bacterium]|nr:hypothetical protein [Gemmatimonadaceae bacterium]